MSAQNERKRVFVEVPAALHEIAKELRTQDNRGTDQPLFAVRVVRHAYSTDRRELFSARVIDQVFLTEEGAREYARGNGLSDIVVIDGGRNAELRAVRDFLLSLPEPVPAEPDAGGDQ